MAGKIIGKLYGWLIPVMWHIFKRQLLLPFESSMNFPKFLGCNSRFLVTRVQKELWNWQELPWLSLGMAGVEPEGGECWLWSWFCLCGDSQEAESGRHKAQRAAVVQISVLSDSLQPWGCSTPCFPVLHYLQTQREMQRRGSEPWLPWGSAESLNFL